MYLSELKDKGATIKLNFNETAKKRVFVITQDNKKTRAYEGPSLKGIKSEELTSILDELELESYKSQEINPETGEVYDVLAHRIIRRELTDKFIMEL